MTLMEPRREFFLMIATGRLYLRNQTGHDAGLNSEMEHQFKWLATPHGRIDCAFDRTMLYGTGGLAFVIETELQLNTSQLTQALIRSPLRCSSRNSQRACAADGRSAPVRSLLLRTAGRSRVNVFTPSLERKNSYSPVLLPVSCEIRENRQAIQLAAAWPPMRPRR